MNQSRVLVTGATGFLGRRTVEMLVEQGFQVRALVRTPSKIGNLNQLGVEIAIGDVADRESLAIAFEDIDYVIHTAADTSGTKEGALKVTIEGTRNVLNLSGSNRILKLVYISSCSVYGSADYFDGQVVDENSPLERYSERRGIYSWAKLEAEKIVLDYINQHKTRVTCLRPGTIYGSGCENFSPMIGFSMKNRIFFVIHKKRFVMPLVYIDNLIHAIIVAMIQDNSAGQFYNVVDSQQVGKKEYMDAFIRKIYPRALCLYLPYGFISSMVVVQEWGARVLKINPALTSYRLTSSQRCKFYDSSKIEKNLGWQSLISFEQAIKRIIDSNL